MARKAGNPFGGKYRIIDFPLSNCINSGIRRVCVLTQYKAHSLIQHIQRGWGFLRGEFGEFVELLPAQQRIDQSSWYKGTTDAVYQNLDIIRTHVPEYILILAGDHIYKMDYGPMLAQHVESKADVTVGSIEVPRERAREFGVLTVNEHNEILRFVEKPQDPKPCRDRTTSRWPRWVFTYLILDSCSKTDRRRGYRRFQSRFRSGSGAAPDRATPGDRLSVSRRANQGTELLARCGDSGCILGANMELVGVDPELNLYDEHWPIWTYQDQSPPAKFVFDDEGRRGMAVDSMIADGCIISGVTSTIPCCFRRPSPFLRSATGCRGSAGRRYRPLLPTA